MQFTVAESTVLETTTVSFGKFGFSWCEKPQPSTAAKDKNELQSSHLCESSYHAITFFKNVYGSLEIV